MTGPVTFRTLDALRALVEERLAACLPAAPPAIVEAMRYGLMGGGKRFRPVLALATAEAVAARDGSSLDAAVEAVMPGACALECIHSYSLVHDDLPAMDDDVLRRGRPTSHVMYGDGMAVLAGDGLLTHAFALMSAGAAPTVSDARRVRAIAELAEAAGAPGMVGGQAIDLIAAGKVRRLSAAPLTIDDLHDMHARKTGALLRAAAVIGAMFAGADDATIEAARGYARHVGLAFQIRDDILDVEGTTAELGKTAGKDAAADKPTFVSQFGLDASRRMAAEVVAHAKQFLSVARLGGRLPEIAEWTIERKS